MNNDDGSGFKTSEFTSQLIAAIVTALVVIFHAQPADATGFGAWLAAAVPVVVAAAGYMAIVLKYIHGRQVKKNQALPTASILPVKASAPPIP